MNTKGKGTNAERQLLHMFWQHNWAAVRVAGSGSMKYDCPDLLVGHDKTKLAIECKVTSSDYQYFSKHEIFSLRSFSHLFGAEAYVAIKFNKRNWFFLKVQNLKETTNNYVVSKNLADESGITFEMILEENKGLMLSSKK